MRQRRKIGELAELRAIMGYLVLQVVATATAKSVEQARASFLDAEPREVPVIVYAFDVDDTLKISDGPVLLELLRELRDAGHAVGLCGNWSLFVKVVPNWHTLVSFLGPIQYSSKAEFLAQLKMYIRADDFVLVGNDPALVPGASDDRGAARQAGWRFVSEVDFSKGTR